MFKISSIFMTFCFVVISTAASANPAAMKAPSNEDVNKACEADATKTGTCAGKKVGAGLISCLNTMNAKAGHKVSENCKKHMDAWDKAQAAPKK